MKGFSAACDMHVLLLDIIFDPDDSPDKWIKIQILAKKRALFHKSFQVPPLNGFLY